MGQLVFGFQQLGCQKMSGISSSWVISVLKCLGFQGEEAEDPPNVLRPRWSFQCGQIVAEDIAGLATCADSLHSHRFWPCDHSQQVTCIWSWSRLSRWGQTFYDILWSGLRRYQESWTDILFQPLVPQRTLRFLSVFHFCYFKCLWRCAGGLGCTWWQYGPTHPLSTSSGPRDRPETLRWQKERMSQDCKSCHTISSKWVGRSWHEKQPKLDSDFEKRYAN